MFQRLADARLRALWRQFPAVLILGARQVGKTTLAQMVFPELPYCDLEEPRLRELFADDPTFQIHNRIRDGLILDEAQAVPAVFAALRGLIDRQRQRSGRFLLLGSAQPGLIRQASESLAGRVGVMDLEPLTAAEARTGESPRTGGRSGSTGAFQTRFEARSENGGRRICVPMLNATCHTWASAPTPCFCGGC